MKVKVIQNFIDKETGKLRKKGDEFTCTKKRYAEIASVGEFVEEIKEPKED